MSVNLRHNWRLIFLIFLILINFTFLTYYSFFSYRYLFHSDSAVKNLLAQEIFETGQFFPEDWNYVNSDLFILLGHVFIIPFLFFYKNSFNLHATSSLFSGALILYGTWLISGILSTSLKFRLLCVAVLSSGISPFMAENLYGQVSYGHVYYITCFITYLGWKVLNGSGLRTINFILLTILVILSFWSNPQRAFIYYILPLIMAAFSFYRFNSLKSVFALCAGVILGCLTGIFLHSHTITTVSNVIGVASPRWLEFDAILANIGHTLHGILEIFGGLPRAGNPVKTFRSFYEILRLLSSLSLVLFIIIILPISFYSENKYSENKNIKFFSIFTLTSFFTVLSLQILTTLPDMSDPVQSSRYLVPSLLFSLLLFLFFSFQKTKVINRQIKFMTILTISILLTSGYWSLIYTTSSNNISYGMKGQVVDIRSSLVDFLVSNNLDYGYATYWNSGSLTVLSSERLHVRQIVIDNGLPMPMRHLSSNRWYRPSAWEGKTFLLLTDEEAKLIDWNKLAKYHGYPSRYFNFENFEIYTFDHNISKNMPGWDPSFESSFYIDPIYSMSHQIGQYNLVSYRDAWKSDIGESGFLAFGPYLYILPGKYKVEFDLELTSELESTFDVGALDVVSNQSKIVHASKVLKSNSSQTTDLEFTLDKPISDLEFRVLSNGNSSITLYGTAIKNMNTKKNHLN